MIPKGSTLKTTITAINSNGQSSRHVSISSPFYWQHPEAEQRFQKWNKSSGMKTACCLSLAQARQIRNAAAHVNEQLVAVDKIYVPELHH